MKQEVLKRFGAAAAFWLLVPGAALAADILPPETAGGWTFTGAVYGWGTGINGEVGILDQPPSDVDVTFSDILENLDFAAMAVGEARNGPFVLGMDLTYVKLGADSDLAEGAPADKLDISMTEWMVTGFAGYTLWKEEFAQFDVIGGARLWSLNTDIDYSGGDLDGTTDSDGETWVDPLIGGKMRVELTPDIYVLGWAMVGGFDVGSEIMWDVMGGAGYSFTEHFDLFAGYRALGVDHRNEGFVYDVVQQGPVIAGVFRF